MRGRESREEKKRWSFSIDVCNVGGIGEGRKKEKRKRRRRRNKKKPRKDGKKKD